MRTILLGLVYLCVGALMTHHVHYVVPAFDGLAEKGMLAHLQGFTFCVGVHFALKGRDALLEKCLYALPMLGILGSAIGFIGAFNAISSGGKMDDIGLVFLAMGYSVFLTIALVAISAGKVRTSVVVEYDP